MSESLRLVILTAASLLHMAGVLIWGGGLVFAMVVFHPSAARHLDTLTRGKMLWDAAWRFRPFVYASLVMIWASGAVMNVLEKPPAGESGIEELWLSMMGIKRVLAFFLTVSVVYLLERLVPRVRKAVEESSTDLLPVLTQRLIGLGWIMLATLAIIIIAGVVLVALPVGE